ncbi:MAG: FHA domain-containing protein [Deltaproteobacteria bacterium]|nr:FHA domain-containing protein [Deltaproteobacteria bacterium]
MGNDWDDDLGGMADSTRMIDISKIDGAPEMGGGPGRVDPLPTGARPWVEIIDDNPDENEEVFVITKPLMMLGRVPNVADIVVRDGKASRHHAAIAHQGGSFVLYDMDSTNGTYVAGERISQHTLSDGDVFSIGETQLLFKLPQ